MKAKIHVKLDSASGLWRTTGGDIEGVVLSGQTIDELLEKIGCVASDLLALNGNPSKYDGYAVIISRSFPHGATGG